MVLYLFLAHLGVGIVLSLVLVGRMAGVKFFRFNAGLAAILIAIAFAFRPIAEVGSTALIGLIALGLAEVATVLYWATVGRSLAAIRPAIVTVACLSGVVSLTAQALTISAGQSLTMQALTVASFLSSAAILGGACTSMVLGHWYLVIPGMQVSLLQSMVKVHIATVVVRIVVVAAAITFAVAAWQPGLGPNFRHYAFSVSGVFLWQRVLFGLLGPAILSPLTWETAKIRSTQSATGILYVDFFTVVVGEVLAKYVLLETRVPV